MTDRYKVIVKVAEATGVPKGVVSVYTRCLCSKKVKDSIKSAVAATSSACAWDSDNTIVKLSLKMQAKELAELTLFDVRELNSFFKSNLDQV